MVSFLCSTKSLFIFFIISAIPVAYIISVERAEPSTHVYHYHSSGWLRECAKWDDLDRRFIVSLFEGGVALVEVPDGHSPGTILEEIIVVKEPELAGNASLGIAVDRRRNRVLVVNADVMRNRYGSLAAYDRSTWRRLFLTQLSGPGLPSIPIQKKRVLGGFRKDGVTSKAYSIPTYGLSFVLLGLGGSPYPPHMHSKGDEKSFADDVAVDEEGNAYVTDAKANKIWKVGVDGEILSIIRSPLFTPKEWYKTLVGLNGVVYHPNGYLLVIHTFSGNLLKIEIEKEEVKLVKVGGGKLVFGDGLELISPTKLVVAGNPSGRLVESSDEWETATVTAKYSGPAHRLATAATVKDGKVYLNHLLGMGYPRKTHALVEAVFSAY
ncbi:hypothetical protein CK203_017558 [Vitis vinifera]|uniref:Calcium-dependent phosphotriesterase superfamily protein n=1 Tax=Vitis vinifera TaxID=29760 RepID=A0A438IXM1_VITVI|nr:hypothetical protein CK203_017558 [Vitis vinifera]